MIHLNDHANIFQWDTGHTVSVGSSCVVYFSMTGDTDALAVQPTGSGSNYNAAIPNILLQRAGTLIAWKVVDGKTEDTTKFVVIPRPKPATYVYEETEVVDYLAIKDAEAQRVAAEAARASAEASRASQWATLKTEAQNATQDATEAADRADALCFLTKKARGQLATIDGLLPDTALHKAKVFGQTVHNHWLNGTTSTQNGVQYTAYDDGHVHVGGAIANSSQAAFDTYRTIETLAPGNTYTLSKTGSSVVGCGLTLELADGSYQYHTSYLSDITFTVPSNVKTVTAYVSVLGTASGSLNLDVWPMLVEGAVAKPFTPCGQLWSLGRTVHNLWPMLTNKTQNGVAVTVGTDGSVTANGTATAAMWPSMTDINLVKGKSYTISGGTPTLKASVNIFDSSGTLISQLQSIGGPETFTVPSTADTISATVVVDSTFSGTHTIYPTIHEGTEALPFTPCSRLWSVDAVDVVCAVSNLADPAKLMYGSNVMPTDADGYYTQNLDYDAYPQIALHLPPGTYTAFKRGTNSSNAYVMIDSASDYSRSFNGGVAQTFTLAKASRVVLLATCLVAQKGATLAIQLNIGTAVLPYEKGSSATLRALAPADATELRSLPDGTCDALTCELGERTVERRTGKVVLDGSEGWSLTNGVFGVGGKATGCSSQFNSKQACDRYTPGAMTGDQHIKAYPSGWVDVTDSTCSTVDAFKSNLAMNPVTLIYEIDPATETLTPADMPDVPASTLNAWGVTEYLSPEVEPEAWTQTAEPVVEHIKASDARIAALEAAIINQ